MKKQLSHILLGLLLLFLFFPVVAKAEDKSRAELTVTENTVGISLEIPAGKKDDITSLRVKLSVSPDNGENLTGSFTFGDHISTTVEDAAWTKRNGNYEMDLILSGKTSLFSKEGILSLGTLTLHSDAKSWSAEVAVSPNSLESVNSFGTHTNATELYAVPVTVKQENREPEVTPTPTVMPLPTPTAAPIPTPTPAPPEPPVVTPSVTPKPTQTPQPTPTPTPEFDTSGKIKLNASVKTGSNRVSFQWKQAKGADGYQIYQYNSKTKKYERMKTVLDPKITAYTSKTLSYGTTYSFKIRAFQTGKNGSRTYGTFGPTVKATTAPAKASAPSLKSAKAKEVSVSWKKVTGASGYQIYRCDSPKGTYKRIKTTFGNSPVTYTNKKLKSKKTYYYKVRAFVTNSSKDRVYGNFSSVKSVKTK